MRSLIVIPTYNEVENIGPLTEQVLKEVPTDTHLLIVDDGSPDGTGKLAATFLFEEDPQAGDTANVVVLED